MASAKSPVQGKDNYQWKVATEPLLSTAEPLKVYFEELAFGLSASIGRKILPEDRVI